MYHAACQLSDPSPALESQGLNRTRPARLAVRSRELSLKPATSPPDSTMQLRRHRQNHAEPGPSLDHSRIGLGRSLQRSRFDYGADALQDTEGQGLLRVDGRAHEAAVDGASPEHQRERARLD